MRAERNNHAARSEPIKAIYGYRKDVNKESNMYNNNARRTMNTGESEIGFEDFDQTVLEISPSCMHRLIRISVRRCSKQRRL